MIEVKKKSIIYVLCPAYTKTGGTELLHQLVYSLNQNNLNAKITYFHFEADNYDYTSSDFKKYVNDYVLINDIKDEKDNILIIPEITVEYVNEFKYLKKVIWWMSVDNYLINHKFNKIREASGLKYAIKKTIKNYLSHNKKDIFKADYHLCQSYYSIDFLTKKGIKEIMYLSDYINDSFLNTKYKIKDKEDLVLYNPKKGFEFTKKIIDKSPDLNWVPIQNMTTEQVKELLLRAKVYIDFGNHPGKDRFPRETAMCGCCVITGKKGAAKFKEDVPILDEFKIDDKESNIDVIIDKIKCCINNFEEEIKKFDGYRNFILNEKSEFNNDVKKIFKLIEKK